MSARQVKSLSTLAKNEYLSTEGAPTVPYPVGASSIEKTALFPRSRPVKTRQKNSTFFVQQEMRNNENETTMSMI